MRWVHRHQHVSCVPRTVPALEAESKRSGENQLGQILPVTYLLNVLSLLFGRTHARLKHPISPLWQPCDRVPADERKVERTRKGSQKKSSDSACACPLPFVLCPLPSVLWNTGEMPEEKRPPCGSERVNMRTEARGADGWVSCPALKFPFRGNIRENQGPDLV